MFVLPREVDHERSQEAFILADPLDQESQVRRGHVVIVVSGDVSELFSDIQTY